MSATTKQKKLESYSMERRPARQLRDFLLEDSSSSSSSTGFKSFPRQPPPSNNNMVIGGSSSPHPSNKSIFMSNTIDPTMNNKLIKRNQITVPTTLQRSRSKSQAAADATMSAIHKLVTYAVSTISISKSFSDKKKKKQKRKSTTSNATAHDHHHHHHWELPTSAVKVCRVKDILRWKSFRDLVVVVDKQQPEAEIEDQCQLSLDHVSADSVTKTNSTAPGSMYTTSSSSSSSSKGSSWGGDSEFSFTTSDELPCGWSGTRTSGHVVKKWVGSTVAVHHGDKKQSVGEDGQVMESMKETMEFEMGSTEEKKAKINDEDEEEQNSPVSVLDDSPFTNDQYHDNDSSFHHSIASLERTKSKLLQSLERFERLASGCNFDLDDIDHEYLPADDSYIIDFKEEEQEDEETKDIQDAPEAIRARELIQHIKSTRTCTSSNSIDDSCEHLLFDFFVQELNKKTSGASNDHEFDMAVMEDEAMSYITRGGGECCPRGGNAIKGGVVLQGHVINDMERETRWCVNKFEEDENEELVVVMEKSVLNDLVDDLLVELF